MIGWIHVIEYQRNKFKTNAVRQKANDNERFAETYKIDFYYKVDVNTMHSVFLFAAVLIRM